MEADHPPDRCRKQRADRTLGQRMVRLPRRVRSGSSQRLPDDQDRRSGDGALGSAVSREHPRGLPETVNRCGRARQPNASARRCAEYPRSVPAKPRVCSFEAGLHPFGRVGAAPHLIPGQGQWSRAEIQKKGGFTGVHLRLVAQKGALVRTRDVWPAAPAATASSLRPPGLWQTAATDLTYIPSYTLSSVRLEAIQSIRRVSELAGAN